MLFVLRSTVLYDGHSREELRGCVISDEMGLHAPPPIKDIPIPCPTKLAPGYAASMQQKR